METEFIKLQHKTINSITNLLESYKDVELIFITGSHSKSEESSFSDIDISFVFSDSSRPQKKEIFNKVTRLYPSLCALWLYDKNGLFLYQNGVRLDLDFLTQTDLEDWDLSNVKIIYDPQNKYHEITHSVTKPVSAPKPKWRNEDGDIIDWFYWMFRQAYCYIKRGKTNKRRSFNKLYNGQTSLNSIREKLLEMKVYLYGKWDYMNEIDSNYESKISLTFSDFNPDNMALATRKLFDLFEVTAAEYCEKEGRAFPKEKVIAMRKLFDDFDNVID